MAVNSGSSYTNGFVAGKPILYVCFDTVPAPKGAATHIEAFARALAAAFGRLELVTVAAGEEPAGPVERWPGVFHTELPAAGRSLIDRALSFRWHLARWLTGREFAAIQFRSIFEGAPLLRLAPAPRLIFEVNGLPSIELKYRYWRAADDRELIVKLVSQERACLRAADLVVTPSAVTARFLAGRRGAAASRIAVIPNGVDPGVFGFDPARPAGGCFRMLYFGTLAPWQGVDLAVRALAAIAPQVPATLSVIGSGTRRRRKELLDLAAKLGVGERMELCEPVGQRELVERLHASDAALAPLGWNDRNALQGCCPLKILESMAAGTPVIASNLEVVRELGADGEHLVLVKPGSVDQLAEAALRLHKDRALAMRLAHAARRRVEGQYTWERAGAALVRAYEALGL
jgi:glycosyltransferase involved in cell wall biosynthesis